MSSASDFLSQYKQISSKLKRRFLKKSNVSEPSDQFASLAAEFERSDLLQYAGLSWCTAARCRKAEGSGDDEGAALTRAGHLFLTASRRSWLVGEEHFQVGTVCLDEALATFGENSPQSAAVSLQAGHSSSALDLHRARDYYTKGCQRLADSPQLLLTAQGNLASIVVQLRDHHDALNIYTQMANTVDRIASPPYGIYSDVLIRCEISRVLLILLMRPTPQKISPELAKFVEKYTWIGEPDPKTTSWLGESLFFMLQSLVMLCQSQDLLALKDLKGDLRKYLSHEQNGLLNAVIVNLNHSEN